MKHRKQEHHTEEKEDLSIDFSGVSKFFNRVNMDVLVAAIFILFAMVLVFSVRMLPAALPVTDGWAASTIDQNIRNQVSAKIDAQFPALPQANRDARINKEVADVIAQNQAEYQNTKAQYSAQFKEQLRYTGDDGKEYTYLGDLDSYFWLRYARNIIRHGNACDTIIDGQCRDMYVVAPQGQPMSASAHVYAIFGLYKFITLFAPQYPMPAASFMLQVLLGVIICIPAFFVGRKLAGNVGGLFVAVLVSMHPLLLSRTLGSDNDQWSFIFPLFLLWMIIEAVEAKDLRRRIIFSALAGLAVALHSIAWEAYWFNYFIVLIGLIGYLLFAGIKSVVREHKKFWENEGVKHAGVVIVVYYIASFIFLLLVGHSSGYFQIPLTAAGQGQAINQAIVSDYWPNVLTTVAELNKASFTDAVQQMGGKWFFFISLVGLLLMLLPVSRWKLRHYIAFGGGALIALYLINATDASRLLVLALLAIPIAAILLMYLIYPDEEEVNIAAALIVLVWFLASIYATYSGVRFILLLIGAFSITFAVAAGRAHRWISEYLAGEVKWQPLGKEFHNRFKLSSVVTFALICLLLVAPIKAGRDTATGYIPSIDDAWWNALTKINQESQPTAVLNSWWDFGHWFKYVADRRVSADGTTQGTHAPRWLGLALVTPDEREAMGTLRMLVCGNDASPTPEGNNGAYGIVLADVKDSIVAQQIVRDLILLDKDKASQYLDNKGFSAAERDRVLNVTHCDPPEDYFITSNDMIGKAGVWAHFGLWNFTKAYIAGHSRNLPQDEAIADLQQKFGMSAAEAESLYYDAKALTTEGDFNQFAAPWPGYITGSWMGCQMVDNDTAMTCPLGLGVNQNGGTITAIDSFTYNISNPDASKMQYGFYQNGQRVGENTGSPQLIVLAFSDHMQDIHPVNVSGGMAVLVDVPGKRMLITDPALVKSQFTQLYYLDGRYSKYFDKFDERNGFSGTRVVVWKVDWDGKPTQTTSSSTTFIGNRNATRNATR